MKITDKRLKRKLREITVICSNCGKSFETLFPINIDLEDATSWYCRKCGTEIGEYFDHVREHEEEAKQLGYFYCWGCKQKIDFKKDLYPYCVDCAKNVEENFKKEEEENNSLK